MPVLEAQYSKYIQEILVHFLERRYTLIPILHAISKG